MRRGFSMVELVITFAIVGIVTAVTLPAWGDLRDRIAVEGAASEVATVLAVARNTAILRATRVRAVLAPDSLRVDESVGLGWAAISRWPGPASHGVTLSASNPMVTFGPIGFAVGLSNTTVRLSKGLQTATLTTSRVGRVKRW